MTGYVFRIVTVMLVCAPALHGAGCNRAVIDLQTAPLSRNQSSGEVYCMTISDGIRFREGGDLAVVAWSVSAEWYLVEDESKSSVSGWVVPHSAAVIPDAYHGRVSLRHWVTPVGTRGHAKEASVPNAGNQLVFMGTVVIAIPGEASESPPEAKAVIRYRVTVDRYGKAIYEPLGEQYVFLEPGMRIRDIPMVTDVREAAKHPACQEGGE